MTLKAHEFIVPFIDNMHCTEEAYDWLKEQSREGEELIAEVQEWDLFWFVCDHAGDTPHQCLNDIIAFAEKYDYIWVRIMSGGVEVEDLETYSD